MSRLIRLDVDRLRNLQLVNIEPEQHINLILGANGSGKTSLLEAIHLLALGRSFRSSRVDPLIHFDAGELVIHGRLHGDCRIGLVKRRHGPQALKLDGVKQRNWQEVARALPVQLLNSDTFSLLEGGARMRRRYLDWGVFHVEHGFLTHWRKAAKALAQRNALLKQNPSSAELAVWDDEFCRSSVSVDACRRRYFDILTPYFHQALEELMGHIKLPPLEFRYFSGWPEDTPLDVALAQNRQRDIRSGMTQAGPHRCDLVIKLGRNPAAAVLSRGQQKLMVFSLKLAQTRLFLAGGEQPASPTADRPSLIYLIDDLAAELDQGNRTRLLNALLALDCQLFFTAVMPEDLYELEQVATSARKFHVEHGKISCLE